MSEVSNRNNDAAASRKNDAAESHTNDAAASHKNNAAAKSSPLGGGSLWGKLLKFGVPLAISVALCVMLFRNVDMAEMMRIIREDCDFRYIGLSVLIGIIPIIVRAQRWGIQLRAIDVNPPFRILFYSIFGTYAFNIVFPRLGEVWRSGYIAYRQDAPFSEVFGSMVADRMADTITVALLTLVTCIFASGPFVKFVAAYPQAYNAISSLLSSPWFWAACAALCLGFWALMKYGKSGPIRKVRNFVKGLWDGFAAIVKMKGKGRWLLLTAILWTCYFTQMWVAFYAFPFTRGLIAENGIMVVFICYMLSTISMGIPSNGGIGPYQTAVLFGMQLFGPAAVMASASSAEAFRTASLAFGNTLLGAQTLTFIIGGIIVFILIAADRRHNARNRSHI